MARTISGAREKLSHRSAHRGVEMLQTTICIPLELRSFVLAESGRPYPGSVQPMGVSRWVQKLIIEEQERQKANFFGRTDSALSRNENKRTK